MSQLACGTTDACMAAANRATISPCCEPTASHSTVHVCGACRAQQQQLDSAAAHSHEHSGSSRPHVQVSSSVGTACTCACQHTGLRASQTCCQAGSVERQLYATCMHTCLQNLTASRTLLCSSTADFVCVCMCCCLQSHHHQHQHHQHHSSSSSSARSGMADASLTWEVPPTLDRHWGPTLADLLPPAASAAAAATAAGSAPAPPAADGSQAARTSLDAAAGSLDIGALPQQGAPSSGLHPLVLLNRQEFGAAAEEHLQQMLKQLLSAEEVQQHEVRQQPACDWAWVGGK